MKASYDKILPKVLKEFGERDMESITTKELQTWFSTIYSKSGSRNTARMRVVSLWRWAAENSHLQRGKKPRLNSPSLTLRKTRGCASCRKKNAREPSVRAPTGSTTCAGSPSRLGSRCLKTASAMLLFPIVLRRPAMLLKLRWRRATRQTSSSSTTVNSSPSRKEKTGLKSPPPLRSRKKRPSLQRARPQKHLTDEMPAVSSRAACRRRVVSAAGGFSRR